jgi:succinate dehydrogenase/fumarate reductase flavoprotein subunit
LNVKKVIKWAVAAGVVAGVAFIADYRRKFVDVGEFNRQLAVLNREHDERQRAVEANLGELGSVVENAIQSANRAGEVVKRTGVELQSAAADLRSAKAVLGSLAVQIKNLQSELDNCRADLYRVRGLVGLASGGDVDI